MKEIRYASLKQNGNGPMKFRVLPVNNYVQVQTTNSDHPFAFPKLFFYANMVVYGVLSLLKHAEKLSCPEYERVVLQNTRHVFMMGQLCIMVSKISTKRTSKEQQATMKYSKEVEFATPSCQPHHVK